MLVDDRMYEQVKEAYDKVVEIDKEVERLADSNWGEIDEMLGRYEVYFEWMMRLLGEMFSGGS